MQHVQGHVVARFAARPQAFVELALVTDGVTGYAHDDVTAPDARARGRALGQGARNHHMPLDLFGINAQPGTRGRLSPPMRDQIAEYRLQQVDGDEHIAGKRDPGGQGVTHPQRRDAQETAVVAQ